MNAGELLANPQKYLDKPFVITGISSVSDYYNYGYTDAKATHYSFSLTVINKAGKFGRRMTLYSARDLGDEAIRSLEKAKVEKPAEKPKPDGQ
jgi:hypothetical protein